MTHNKYNGWTNYETWATNLWLGNDEGTWNHWLSRANDLVSDADGDEMLSDPSDAKDNLARELASELESDIAGAASEALGDAGLLTDLLNSALSEVDWYVLAEHFVDEPFDERFKELKETEPKE